MKITWYGHAAFLVEGAGRRVILDPYTSNAEAAERSRETGTEVGGCGDYAPIDEPADVVAISHINEKYHSNLRGVRGQPVVVNGLELFDRPQTAAGITFHAVRVWENDERQEPIAMLHFELDGLRVCHMGDLGHGLSPQEATPVWGVDVLLALAGGRPTICLPDLKEAIAAIAPRIVIPMHFWTPRINLNLLPVEQFLGLFPPEQIDRRDSPTLEVTRATLPATPKIVVLQHAR
jgi:L-ascorbate metabolism protein UlaG (beta-lactamase superfamily)